MQDYPLRLCVALLHLFLMCTFNAVADELLDLTSVEAVRQAYQRVDLATEDAPYSIESQFLKLQRLGLFNEALSVHPLLLKAYKQLEPRTPQALIRAGKALSFGIAAHTGVEDMLKEQGWLKYLTLWFVQNVGASLHWMPIESKNKFALLYATNFSGASTAVLYRGNAWNRWYALSSLYPNILMDNKAHFMESCKLSDDIQNDIDMKRPVQSTMKRIARRQPGFELADEALEGNTASEYIKNVLNKAANNEGMMYLLVFSGKEKYQFFLLGTYHGMLNLFFVADNKAPVPVVIFSMPLWRTSYTMLAKAIERTMNGVKERDKVPELAMSVLMLNNNDIDSKRLWTELSKRGKDEL